MTRRLSLATIKVLTVAGSVTLVAMTIWTVPTAQSRSSAAFPSPDEWTPFTADATKTNAGGAVLGRFYRWSDGSTRLDSGPSRSDLRSIDIKNVGLERSFTYNEASGWTERPMKLRTGVLAPPRVRARDLADSPRMRFENREAFIRTDPGGIIRVVVPELNFFLVDFILPNGDRTRHDNVRIGEPPVEFLLPPPGAFVAYSPEFGGIIEHGPEDTVIDPDTGAVTFK
jgi:hypothetical protein